MDNAILKKKLNTFKSDKGTLKDVSNDVVFEVLRSWEHWPGKSSDLYRELGLSKMQMVTMIQKAKKLVKSGMVPSDDFKEIKVADQNFGSTFPCQGIEVSWDGKNLWKKIAQKFNVRTNFEVTHAEKKNGVWSLSSKSGERVVSDIILWTAPLDRAASVLPLSPQLKEVFSKIRYQFYGSTLVDVKGFGKNGSGVIPKNYETPRSGNVVSWLFRHPTRSNVANFYTLSNEYIAPEEVEARVSEFARIQNLTVSKFIKSISWKYFPHFSQLEMDAGAYRVIESSQGGNGIYFAGEIMNFSTVEHSAEYSRELIDRYFARSQKLSVELPREYSKFSAKEKLKYLWDQVERTKYSQLPKYPSIGGIDGLFRQMGMYFPEALAKAFNNNTDFIADGREKLIHKLGSVALISFKATNPNYRDFDGLIRLSNAVEGSSGTMYPSFSIKIPLDGADRSINITVGKSFDPQTIGNDPKGAPDFNFFRDDSLFPFSNELPKISNTWTGWIFKTIFDLAHSSPNYVPVEEIGKILTKPAPRRLVFRAPPPIRDFMPSKYYVDEREIFASIPEGSVLFDLYESTGLSDRGEHVGSLTTRSKFVASSFGDKNLYFRHENGGLKKTLREFSQSAD